MTADCNRPFSPVRSTNAASPFVSVVVPVYNEEESLSELYKRVVQVLETAQVDFELVFVSDGSTDDSFRVMQDLRGTDSRVKAVELSRNFGHQSAVFAGMDYATGDAIITMDADLQHPPELIPKLIEKWVEGYDVVYTCRQDTEDAGPVKKATSRLFYSLVNRLSDTRIPEGAADFRLLDRSVAGAIRDLGERGLFMRGLVSWVGYRQTAVRYSADARFAGKSKYSLVKMLRFGATGITSFSSIPLHISAVLGSIVSLLAFAYAAYAIHAKLFTDLAIEGWTSVMAAVLMLGGLQLVALGILGAYLGRVHDEVRRRPRYLVRRVCGFERRPR